MDSVCSPRISCLFSPSVPSILPSHFSPPIISGHISLPHPVFFISIYPVFSLPSVFFVSFYFLPSAQPPAPFPLLIFALPNFYFLDLPACFLALVSSEKFVKVLDSLLFKFKNRPAWMDARQHFNADKARIVHSSSSLLPLPWDGTIIAAAQSASDADKHLHPPAGVICHLCHRCLRKSVCS